VSFKTLLLHFFSFTFFLGLSSSGFAQYSIPYDSIPSNDLGTILLPYATNWLVSTTAPPEILRNKNSLIEGKQVYELTRDYVKKVIGENKYGWAELTFTASAEDAKIPLWVTYRGFTAAIIWLNGVLVHTAGTVSTHPKDEVLNDILIKESSEIKLAEGENYLLVEFSHTSLVEQLDIIDSNPILYLFVYFLPSQKRINSTFRAFFFGASLFTLLILIVTHAYLSIKSIHKYHLYATFSNLFLLIHLLNPTLQSLVGLSNNHIVFFEVNRIFVFIYALYYLFIAIRSFYKLSIPYFQLRMGVLISTLIGLYALFFDINIVVWLHSSIFIIAVIYAIYTLYQKVTLSDYREVYGLLIGLFITLLGILSYIVQYWFICCNNELLYLIAITFVYIGVPMSFLVSISQNFAKTFHSIEEQVKDRTKELEERDSFKTRFLANISHELRTPVTILNGLISKAISKKKNDDKIEITAQEAALINRNIDRLSTLVSQIVALSKSDGGDIVLNLKLFSIVDIIKNSIDLTRSIFEMKHQHIELHSETDSILLKVDGEKILTIIYNLLTNASKFSPANSLIQIETRINTELTTLEIDVIDQGIGINPTDEEIIFERFFRLKNTNSDYVEGMGIGLELSRVFARKHGGEITVIQQNEPGSRFRLSLPYEEHLSLAQLPKNSNGVYQPNSSQHLNSHSKDSLSEKVPHILLVEDNPDMQEFVSCLLQDLGKISVSSDGLHALKVLANEQIDLVVTDLMMPNMTGEQLIQKMGEDAKLKSIPVIVLSAKHIEENRLNLLRVGVIDYITKPFNSEELLLKISNLLKLAGIRKKAQILISTDEVEISQDLSETAKTYILSRISVTSLIASDLAHHFLTSERSLYRKLEHETGLAPAAFIREVRLQYAARLLEASKDIRLNEIADKVGYKSPSSFKKAFVARFGISPV